MIQVEWLTLVIIALVMLMVGWIFGENVGTSRYFRKRHVGTIVYVDKQEEAVTVQFNSEESIHEMKNFDCVVFNVKSLD